MAYGRALNEIQRSFPVLPSNKTHLAIIDRPPYMKDC